jgi:hypothetical protein
MGFDVSYHPIDLKFVDEVVAPYIAGKKSLDLAITRACTRELCRYRAKAWALGVFDAMMKRSQRPKKKTKGKKSDAESSFDSNLHVWGRPFLIAADTPEEVSSAIDRYLAAKTNAQVDKIAKEMVTRIDGTLKVTPNMENGPAKKKELPSVVLRDLDVLPDVFAAARKGAKAMKLPSGDDADPAEILASSAPLLVLCFASRFRPGWMDRGHVWPTHLMHEAKLPAEKFFEPPAQLLGTLLDELPKATKKKVRAGLYPSIVQNYMVGGLVRAERVPALRKLLRDKRDKLLAKPKQEQWEDECKVSLQKLDEALADAERRGLAFVEATEVYSGPMGIVN